MKYVLVLLLTIAQLFFFAQIENKEVKEGKKGQKKHRISIGMYHTKAIGKFSSIEKDNYSAGFAEVGTATSIKYQILLTNNSNLVFSFTGSEYSYNEPGFIEYIEFDSFWINRNAYAENYRVSLFTFGYKFSGGSQIIKGFVNPFFGYSRMIAGRIEVSANTRNGDGLLMVQTESSPASGLCYGINGGLEFYISEWINLNLEMGVVGSSFDIEAEFTSTSTRTIMLFPDYRLPFSAINIGASFGVTF
jgi:hypothetical protein